MKNLHITEKKLPKLLGGTRPGCPHIVYAYARQSGIQAVTLPTFVEINKQRD